MLSENYNLIIVLGPTASGKTSLAAEIAYENNCEIISADSRQVYRKMTIGTGKDLSDYTINGTAIKYHLIDIHDPGYKYNVFEFQKDFFSIFQSIHENGKMPLLCGGSGMYIESVTKGYRMIHVPVNEVLRKKLNNKSLTELNEILASFKNQHNRSDTDTIKRAVRAIEIAEYSLLNPEMELNIPQINPVFIGLKYTRELQRAHITERLSKRLVSGMIEEVKSLLEEGINSNDLQYYGLEYKFITEFILGQITYEEMKNKLNIAIHQFAKRQMTWFRKMEREGIDIHWIDAELDRESKMKMVRKVLLGQ